MKALVSGGGGFLGGALVRRLVGEGAAVRSLQRGVYPELDALGVEQIIGDIADPNVVERAVAGCEVVFHVAAKVEMWGGCEPFYRTNVIGTDNVLAAMRRHGAARLVFTSSPSVVHGRGDLAGVDESAPYPDRFEAAYPQTKAMAEIAVLAANDPDLATTALRPHLIWGPGDRNLVPQLVAQAAGASSATARTWSTRPTSTMRSMPTWGPPRGSLPARRARAAPTSSPTGSRGRSARS